MNTRIIATLCLLASLSMQLTAGYITKIDNQTDKEQKVTLGWADYSDTVTLKVKPNSVRNYDNEGYCVNYINIHGLKEYHGKDPQIQNSISTGASMVCRSFTIRAHP